MKKINPNLKTLLAVGGYNEGSARYSRVSYEQYTNKLNCEKVFMLKCQI